MITGKKFKNQNRIDRDKQQAPQTTGDIANDSAKQPVIDGQTSRRISTG
jgi:hypothetical protein